MMAAYRPTETPGAPRVRKRKTRPSGIWISRFLLQKRRWGIPGDGKTTWRNRKEKTTRKTRDERTTQKEKGRRSREP
ncbi:hypothetical protein NDU88_001938 [Pleurodeles waltl]|uniref:Uncharacterized protein n=1 Tax=Pleurodeles waltl TaxID=8319 RepID=A0AAV7SBT4_PLEWA|nr:hypothetical protein NDU88_001938 [Pleurodeles waltl]